MHRHRLTLKRVDELAARLAAMPLEDRRGVPGLDPARASAIVAGTLIVAEAVRAASWTRSPISETDLLDGVALAAAGSPKPSFRL